MLECIFKELTRWDRLSSILPPEGQCSWDDHVQFCRLKREREGEVLRTQMQEYGQEQEREWAQPEADELDVVTEVADGMLDGLVDDAVQGVLDVLRQEQAADRR